MLNLSVKPINAVNIIVPTKPTPGIVAQDPILYSIDPTPLPGNIQPVLP